MRASASFLRLSTHLVRKLLAEVHGCKGLQYSCDCRPIAARKKPLRPVERRKLLLALAEAKELIAAAEKTRRSGEKEVRGLAEQRVGKETWKKLGEGEREMILAAVREQHEQVAAGVLPAAGTPVPEPESVGGGKQRKDRRRGQKPAKKPPPAAKKDPVPAPSGRRASITEMLTPKKSVTALAAAAAAAAAGASPPTRNVLGGSLSASQLEGADMHLELRVAKKW